jgi:hypothetical protein
VQAVRDDQFLILPDEFHQSLVRRRGQDINAFVESRLRGVGGDARPPMA